MIDVFALDGTGYPPSGTAVLNDFLLNLDPERFRIRRVDYPASGFGIGTAYPNSVEMAKEALTAAVRVAPVRPFMVAGYSQGAVAAGDWAQWYLREWGGRVGGEYLRGVALIADGRRPAGTATPGYPIPPGYGIEGERDLHADIPILYAAAHGDPICALPAGNPLRSVADIVRWASIHNPQEASEWGSRLLDAAVRGRLQDWWRLDKRAGWNGALGFARGYLFDGRHTTDYLRYGHTRRLAEEVILRVREV